MIINLTPHAVVLNDGTEFPASGSVARVKAGFEVMGKLEGVPTFKQTFGAIEGLPAPEDGTIYIVSGLVLAAAQGRTDVVAPATGHPECRRNEAGQIVSVPGFVRA